MSYVYSYCYCWIELHTPGYRGYFLTTTGYVAYEDRMLTEKQILLDTLKSCTRFISYRRKNKLLSSGIISMPTPHLLMLVMIENNPKIHNKIAPKYPNDTSPNPQHLILLHQQVKLCHALIRLINVADFNQRLDAQQSSINVSGMWGINTAQHILIHRCHTLGSTTGPPAHCQFLPQRHIACIWALQQWLKVLARLVQVANLYECISNFHVQVGIVMYRLLEELLEVLVSIHHASHVRCADSCLDAEVNGYLLVTAQDSFCALDESCCLRITSLQSLKPCDVFVVVILQKLSLHGNHWYRVWENCTNETLCNLIVLINDASVCILFQWGRTTHRAVFTKYDRKCISLYGSVMCTGVIPSDRGQPTK